MNVRIGSRLRHSLDLGLIAIQLGVEHRMRAETIGAELDEERAAGGADVVGSLLRRVVAREDVHPVDREGGYLVRRRLRGEVGLRLRPLQRGAHRVKVVLATEQHRQPPQRGHVQRLVERALGDGTVAEIAGGDPVAVQHRVGQRQTHRQRQAAGDDRVAAVEPSGGVEQVHRPAPAPRAALLLAEHLGHDRGHRQAAQQRVRMLAVGGHHRVLGGQRPQ